MAESKSIELVPAFIGTAVKCDCGMQFVVTGVLEADDECQLFDIVPCYCVYCGKPINVAGRKARP